MRKGLGVHRAAKISRRTALGGMTALAAAGALARPALAANDPVRLGITGGTQGLWRYMAANKAEHLEKPLGRKFEFKIFPADAGMRTTYLANDLEIFTTIVPEAPALIERGIDVQFLFPIAWVKEAAVLVFTKSSGITSIAAAKGKNISTIPLQNAGGALFRALLLANHGIKMEEHFKLVGTPFPEVPLEAGQVDGAVLLSRQWSRLEQSGKYVPVTNMSAEWSKVKQSPQLLAYGGLISRRDWNAANKPVIEGLIAAATKGMEHLKRNRAEFLEITRNYTADGAISAQPLPVASFNTWSLGMDDVGPERVRLTKDDAADYRVVFGLLEKSGYLKAPPDIDRMFYFG